MFTKLDKPTVTKIYFFFPHVVVLNVLNIRHFGTDHFLLVLKPLPL